MPKNNRHSGGSTPADGKDQDRSGTMSKTDKDLILESSSFL